LPGFLRDFEQLPASAVADVEELPDGGVAGAIGVSVVTVSKPAAGGGVTRRRLPADRPARRSLDCLPGLDPERFQAVDLVGDELAEVGPGVEWVGRELGLGIY
jgi:hypothetical protein